MRTPNWGQAEASSSVTQDLPEYERESPAAADPLKETIYLPFHAEFRSLKYPLSKLKTGTLALNGNGIVISGKDAAGKDAVVAAPWTRIRKIVTNNKDLRASIVYDAPGEGGATTTQSLTTRFEAPLYTAFLHACDELRPGRVEQGQTQNLTLLYGLIAAAAVVLAAIAVVIVRMVAH